MKSLFVWLGVSLSLLGVCLLVYRGQPDALGLAGESFSVIMGIIAFPSSIFFGVPLVLLMALLIHPGFVPNPNPNAVL